MSNWPVRVPALVPKLLPAPPTFPNVRLHHFLQLHYLQPFKRGSHLAGRGLSAGLPDWGHWYTGGDTTHHCTALEGQGGVGGGVCDLLTSDPTSSPCSSPRTGSKQRCWAGLGWAGARSMRDDERNAAAGVKLPGPGPRRAVGSPIARTICRL